MDLESSKNNGSPPVEFGKKLLTKKSILVVTGGTVVVLIIVAVTLGCVPAKTKRKVDVSFHPDNTTYYFPFVIEKNLPIDDAVAECQSFEGYTHAGLAAANPSILEATASLVDKSSSPAVWAGGHLKLHSAHPFLVYWHDGKVTDSSKVLGHHIFCKDMNISIHELKNNKLKGPKATAELIVPLVRLRGKSSCISLYTDDVLGPERRLAPLCVTDRPKIYLETANGLVVLPFLENMFNRETRLLDDMIKHVSNENNTLFSIMNTESPFFLVSFIKEMPYSYTKEFCHHVRISNETEPTGLVSDYVFNSDSAEQDYGYRSKMTSDWNAKLGKLPGYSVFTNDAAFATAGYFNFTGTHQKGKSSWHKQLFWEGPEGDAIIGTIELRFRWCDKLDDKLFIDQHENYSTWYSNHGGNLTTEPNLMPVHLFLRNNDTEHCLRPSRGDFYWPDAEELLPTCEKRRL